MPHRPAATVVKRRLTNVAIGFLALSVACGTVVRTDHITTSQPDDGDRPEYVLRADSATLDSNADMGSKLEPLFMSQRLAVDNSISPDAPEYRPPTFKLEVDGNAIGLKLQENVLASVAIELGIMAEKTDQNSILASAANLVSGTTSEPDSQAFSPELASVSSSAAGLGAPFTTEISLPQSPIEAISINARASIDSDSTGSTVPGDDNPHPEIASSEIPGFGDAPATTVSYPAKSGEDPSDDSSPSISGTSDSGSTNSNSGSQSIHESSSGDSEHSNGDEPDTGGQADGSESDGVVGTADEPQDGESDDDSSHGNSGTKGSGSTNSNSGSHSSGSGSGKSSDDDSDTSSEDEQDSDGQSNGDESDQVVGTVEEPDDDEGDDDDDSSHGNSGTKGNGSTNSNSGSHSSGSGSGKSSGDDSETSNEEETDAGSTSGSGNNNKSHGKSSKKVK